MEAKERAEADHADLKARVVADRKKKAAAAKRATAKKKAEPKKAG
jgi:hypothetical protein